MRSTRAMAPRPPAMSLARCCDASARSLLAPPQIPEARRKPHPGQHLGIAQACLGEPIAVHRVHRRVPCRPARQEPRSAGSRRSARWRLSGRSPQARDERRRRWQDRTAAMAGRTAPSDPGPERKDRMASRSRSGCSPPPRLPALTGRRTSTSKTRAARASSMAPPARTSSRLLIRSRRPNAVKRMPAMMHNAISVATLRLGSTRS